MPYYAVRKGKKPGIYETWAEAKPLVIGFFGAKFRKFETREEAENFISEGGICDGGVGNSTTTEDVCVEPDETLIAFCDGACSRNGKKDAKAGYSSIWPFHSDYNGSWALQGVPKTNNRAELMGVIKTIEIADKIDDTRTKSLIIYSDSALVKNTVNMWLDKWVANNYKKSDGKEALNKDLLEILYELKKQRSITIKYVRAHTNGTDFYSINNDIADRLAKNAIL